MKKLLLILLLSLLTLNLDAQNASEKKRYEVPFENIKHSKVLFTFHIDCICWH